MKLVRAEKGYRKVGDKWLLAKKCTNCGRWLVASTDNFHKNNTGQYGLRGECKDCTSKKNKTKDNTVNTNPSITKVCSCCGREFPATTEYFHKNKTGKYGLMAICKFCRADKRFEADDEYPVNTDPSITKVCTRCGKEYPATTEYFHKLKGGKYGLHSVCKDCTSKKNKTKDKPVNTDPSILQVCTCCGKEYPATTEYFHKSKKGKYGLQRICKECAAEKGRQYRENNKDKSAESHRRYRESNKDKIAEYRRQYRESNKDKIAEYYRQYYQNNKDKILESKRRYRESNKDKIAEYDRRWRENNPDKVLEYSRRQNEKHRQARIDAIIAQKRAEYEAERAPLVTEKTCNCCGRTLPASEFYANKKSKDHLQNYCKECHNKKAKERYYQNLENKGWA